MAKVVIQRYLTFVMDVCTIPIQVLVDSLITVLVDIL